MTTARTTAHRRSAFGLVVRETRYQQLLFWRNRFGAVFTIVFSSPFLILLSATNTGHIKTLHDINYAQYYTPGFMAYGLMSACFNNLAISTVIRRETGLLKRLRLSPLPGWALIAALVINVVVVSIAGAALLLVIGVAGFGVTLSAGAALPIIAAILIGAVAFSLWGSLSRLLCPTRRRPVPPISIVFFLLLFLSGLWFPLTPGSTLANISGYFPVRRIILATTEPFIRHGTSPWAWGDLGVVAIWGAFGACVALRWFRWSRWKDDHSS